MINIQRLLPITAIVLTLNEEKNLPACLESLGDFVETVYVVDSGSTDRTVEIAQTYGAETFLHPFENYAQQRNWAQNNLSIAHDWILHVDADERISAELQQSIREFFQNGTYQQVNGAIFSRRTIFMGRWIRYGGHYPVYHSRLYNKAYGHCEERLYDQHFVVEAPIQQLTGDLIDILTTDLDSWSRRHIRWAGMEAAEQTRAQQVQKQVQGRLSAHPIERRRWYRQALFGSVPHFWRALFYFLYRYILRLGFLDGREGLIFHFLQGFWFRFYIDAKIWELNQSGADEQPESTAIMQKK